MTSAVCDNLTIYGTNSQVMAGQYSDEDAKFVLDIKKYEDKPTPIPPEGQLVADGIYRLQSDQNKQFLAAPDNFNVIETNQDNNLDQQWKFEHHGNDIYTITLAATGNRLEVPYGKTNNGTIIGVTDYDGAGNHLTWKVTKQSDIFFLSPYHDVSKSLDVRPGDNKVHIWSTAASNQNQHWNIIPVVGQKFGEVSQQISVYPNPATDFINVASVDKSDLIQIYDIQGRLVFKTHAETLNTIQMIDNIQSFTSGVYFLKVGL